MERIEDIDLEAETEALERHGDLTLYTFDEYGRLMCYARITAGTRQAGARRLRPRHLRGRRRHARVRGT